MATFTIGPTNGTVQKYYLAYVGSTATLNAANFPWFSAASLSGVYGLSANRQSYVSNKPGAAFPSVTQLVQGTTYELDLKAQVQLDDTQFILTATASTVSQRLSFPAGATGYAFAITVGSGEAGTYGLDVSLPTTGLSAISYAKTSSGSTTATTVSLPVTLAVGDTLTVTATTASGTPGSLALLTQ